MTTAGARVVPLGRLPADGPLAPFVALPVLVDAPVAANVAVGPEYWRLTLAAPAIADRAHPGQFVMLTVARPGEPAPVLPRPMAIFAISPRTGTIDVVYRVVGEGTRRLTEWQPGDPVTVVGPLGRGFVLRPGARRIALLGRGIGICSLTALATAAGAAGIEPIVVVSGRDASAITGVDTFRAAGARSLHVARDDDGSSDVAQVASWLEAACAAGVDELYVCGSARFLALAATLADAAQARRRTAEGERGPVDPAAVVGVQVSLEAHMACGLGFCHGCAAGRPGLPHETPLVCADGPVFRYLPVTPAEAVREPVTASPEMPDAVPAAPDDADADDEGAA